MTSFSPSSMKLFMECREKWRYRYIEGIETADDNISLAWGKVVHKLPEAYWLGKKRIEAHTDALAEFNTVAAMSLPAKSRTKWLALGDSLAETVDIYYDFHGDERDTIKPVLLEREFEHGGVNGRIDQLLLNPDGRLELRELKTASEIISEETNSRFGFTDNMRERWRKEYREQLLRNWGIQVYDWYLRSIPHVFDPVAAGPSTITVEVMLKPYRDKKPELVMFDITEEVISYRERTAQQIEWITREMAEYVEKYGKKQPWPMSETACHGKYGACEFLPLCNHGLGEKTAKLYKIREKR